MDRQLNSWHVFISPGTNVPAGTLKYALTGWGSSLEKVSPPPYGVRGWELPGNQRISRISIQFMSREILVGIVTLSVVETQSKLIQNEDMQSTIPVLHGNKYNSSNCLSMTSLENSVKSEMGLAFYSLHYEHNLLC